MAKIGRPRTNCPEPDELIELGKDLVAWASDDSPEAKKEKRWRYCEWYCGKHGFTDHQWEKFRGKEEFCGYYEQARLLLAKNYIDGTINPSIAHRFLRIYCPDLKREENEEVEHKASLAKEVGGSISDVQQSIIDSKKRS